MKITFHTNVVTFLFIGVLFSYALQAKNDGMVKNEKTIVAKTPKKPTIKKHGKKDVAPVDYGNKNFVSFEGGMIMNNYTHTEEGIVGGFTQNLDTKIATSAYNIGMNYMRRYKHFYYGGGFGYFYGKDDYTFPIGKVVDSTDDGNYNFAMIGLYADAKFDFLNSKFTPFIECKAGWLWKFYEEKGKGIDFKGLYVRPSLGLAYMFPNGRVELKFEPIKFFNSDLEDDMYEMGVTIGYSVRF